MADVFEKYEEGVLPFDSTTLRDAYTLLTLIVRDLDSILNIKAKYAEIKEIEDELIENMLWLPNLPHESVPVFDNEEHNVAGQLQGALREFDFDPKPHWELGPALGIIDFERGVKLSGSRHYILKSWGARLQRALISFFLDTARGEWLYRNLCAIHRAWRHALRLGAVPQVSGHCIRPRRG